MKYTAEEKAMIVKKVISKELPIRTAARNYNVSTHLIYNWIDKFNGDGIAGMKRRYVLSDNEFKKTVVLDHKLQGHSFRQTGIKHGVSGPTVKKWVEIYDTNKEEAFRTDEDLNIVVKIGGNNQETEQYSSIEEEEYFRAKSAYLRKLQEMLAEKNLKEEL